MAGSGGAPADDDRPPLARCCCVCRSRYVPREWMLAEAYTAAEDGNHTALYELKALFQRPYDEQPHAAARFYRRAPPSAARQGGIGFMS